MRAPSSAGRPSRAVRRRWWAALGLLAVLLPVALVHLPDPGSARRPPVSVLPFVLPSAGVLQASPRKVFVHDMTPLPVSIDNQAPATDYYARNYLTPTGEAGKHLAYGGYLRDRPLGQAPLADPAWKLRNLETEVRQARSAGIDGFSVDLLALGDTGGTNWDNMKLMLQAATNVDPAFKIMLMPDMTSSPGTRDAPTLARYLAELGASPAAYRLADGRLVVSPFLAEKHTADWWKQFLDIMSSTYHLPVAFLPVFANSGANRDAFAPISYGMSNWGNRNPAGNDPTNTSTSGPTGQIAAVHALGKAWMQPVSMQDERPRSGVYDEALNTTNLRNTWQIAIANHAELVQIPTWNDYAEGSGIAPSAKHGWSYLDISSYYLTWFKTGSAPAITQDSIYLTHRTQPYAAVPSFPQTTLMTLRPGSSPARDTVEALTFLTAPGTVHITAGTHSYDCNVPAGPGTCTVPLADGTITASTTRNGTTTANITSPYPVTNHPYVQDLQYVAASSARQGTTADTSAPTAPTALTTTVAGSSLSLAWSGASDDRGVVGYDVYRSKTSDVQVSPAALLTSTVAPALTNGPLAVGSWYYRVVSKDAAGNSSTASSVTGGTVVDTTAPTTPTAPAASATGSSMSVSWPASADDVAVTGYDVYRSATPGFTPSPATLVTRTAVPQLTDGGLAPGAWYYRVVAVDAAANSSSPSTEGVGIVAAPISVPVTPVSDTYANQGAPSRSFATSSSLSSRGSVGATSYLRFAVPSAPPGRVLLGATLVLHTNTLSTAGSLDTQAITLSSDLWIDSTTTWNNRPAAGGTLLGTLQAGTLPDMSYATTLDVVQLRAQAGRNVSLSLSSTGTDSLWVWSSEFTKSAARPQLVLTYQ